MELFKKFLVALLFVGALPTNYASAAEDFNLETELQKIAHSRKILTQLREMVEEEVLIDEEEQIETVNVIDDLIEELNATEETVDSLGTWTARLSKVKKTTWIVAGAAVGISVAGALFLHKHFKAKNAAYKAKIAGYLEKEKELQDIVNDTGKKAEDKLDSMKGLALATAKKHTDEMKALSAKALTAEKSVLKLSTENKELKDKKQKVIAQYGELKDEINAYFSDQDLKWAASGNKKKELKGKLKEKQKAVKEKHSIK